MTPAQFVALDERQRESEKREDRRAGSIITVMRRIMGDRNAEIFDFFPEHKEEVPKRAQSGSDVRKNFRGFIEAQKTLKKRRG